MAERTLSVTGMACDGCEQSVEEALEALDGVSQVEADHQRETVALTVEGDITESDLAAAVDEAGYTLQV